MHGARLVVYKDRRKSERNGAGDCSGVSVHWELGAAKELVADLRRRSFVGTHAYVWM